MSAIGRPGVVVLISGTGRNLQAIIDGVAAGQIPAELRAVISNRPDVQGLQRARDAGIPALTLPHTDFPDRDAFDAALREQIEEFEPDIVPLAGFMRVLGGAVVRHFHGRMINIHPSLLPRYRGLHTHRRALEAGDREHGASVHFVTEELDGGPVILQGRVPIRDGDDEEQLADRVMREVELDIYPQVVSWMARGEVTLGDTGVCFRGTPLDQPLQWRDGRVTGTD